MAGQYRLDIGVHIDTPVNRGDILEASVAIINGSRITVGGTPTLFFLYT